VPFVELDPALAWKAVEGYQNELEGEKKRLEAFYRQFTCKRCGGKVRQETHSKHCFSDPDTLVARAMLRCVDCDCCFDPHTGIVLELGDPNKLLNVPIVGEKK
jgi:hypothetical protein